MMAKEIFKNLPDTSTPLSASKLNGLFDGEESMGSIVVEDISCKNLFDTTKYISTTQVRVLNNTNGTLELQGVSEYYAGLTQSFDVIPNQKYTLSYNATIIDTSVASDVYVQVKDYDNETSLIVGRNTGKQTLTFTPTGNKIYIFFRVNITTNTGHSKWENIQLEKSSVATDYVEHKDFNDKEPKLIWNGDHYTIGNNNIQYFAEPLKTGKQYIFVVQGLSSSFRMSFPYIYGTGNEIQFNYYDGTTVVRWRIGITGDGSGFYLSDGSMNMGSNTAVRQVYKVN